MTPSEGGIAGSIVKVFLGTSFHKWLRPALRGQKQIPLEAVHFTQFIQLYIS